VRRRGFAQLKRAGRYISRREPDRIADRHDSDQPVARPGIEQHVLGKRPRCHHTHDCPRNNRLPAARLRCRRTFDLFGNRDPEPAPDQFRQISIRRMNGHAAHRHARTIMFTACGQRDVEARGGRLGILKEQLEKIAHPVEQQAIGRFGLERMILRHHRCGLGCRGLAHRICIHVPPRGESGFARKACMT